VRRLLCRTVGAQVLHCADWRRLRTCSARRTDAGDSITHPATHPTPEQLATVKALPVLNQAWEDVADDVTGAIEKAVQPLLKKAVDDIYGGLLDATQDYLKDNLAFNIASRISTAEREAAGERVRNMALCEELREARTTISVLRTQIMVEVNRGVDRWEGVPEKLRERLDAINDLVGCPLS
jgi:hypothetical protein